MARTEEHLQLNTHSHKWYKTRYMLSIFSFFFNIFYLL